MLSLSLMRPLVAFGFIGLVHVTVVVTFKHASNVPPVPAEGVRIEVLDLSANQVTPDVGYTDILGHRQIPELLQPDHQYRFTAQRAGYRKEVMQQEPTVTVKFQLVKRFENVAAQNP